MKEVCCLVIQESKMLFEIALVENITAQKPVLK